MVTKSSKEGRRIYQPLNYPSFKELFCISQENVSENQPPGALGGAFTSGCRFSADSKRGSRGAPAALSRCQLPSKAASTPGSLQVTGSSSLWIRRDTQPGFCKAGIAQLGKSRLCVPSDVGLGLLSLLFNIKSYLSSCSQFQAVQRCRERGARSIPVGCPPSPQGAGSALCPCLGPFLTLISLDSSML